LINADNDDGVEDANTNIHLRRHGDDAVYRANWTG